jgi:hypothetical protein
VAVDVALGSIGLSNLATRINAWQRRRRQGADAAGASTGGAAGTPGASAPGAVDAALAPAAAPALALAPLPMQQGRGTLAPAPVVGRYQHL